MVFSRLESPPNTLCRVRSTEGDAEVFAPGFGFAGGSADEGLLVDFGNILCVFGESVEIIDEGMEVDVVVMHLVAESVLDGLGKGKNEVYCGTVEVVLIVR